MSKGYGQRSLVTAMFALILVLVVFTWAVTLETVFSSVKAYQNAERTLLTNGLVDKLLQGAQNLAFERGRTNVLLNAPGPAGAADLSFICARRAAVSENLDGALAAVLAEGGELSDRVAKEYGSLRALRLEVDAALAAGREGRDRSLSVRWFDTTSRLISGLGRLATGLSLEPGSYTLMFRSYSRLKVSALALRNDLGMEASRIAAAASTGRGLESGELASIMYLRGRSASEWDALGRERLSVNNPRVDAAIHDVDKVFFGSFRPLQDKALSGLSSPGASGVPVAELLEASVPALDSIASLMSVLSEETALDALRYRRISLANLVTSVVIALLALVTGICSLAFLARRLARPLHRLSEQLGQLAGGNLGAELSPVGKDDEMARLHAAVVSFRDSLVERHRLEEKLAVQSVTDALTGLANRRRLDEVLGNEWQRALRAGQPLSLVMMDIDRFKAFNDRYGHIEGDRCLKLVADSIAAHTRRPMDLAARYGGEEFLSILPGLSAEEAKAWAERVRLAVEELAIPHHGSELGTVTISSGVVSFVPSPERTVQAGLELADKALYRAKEGGRNRVMLAAPRA